MPPDANQYPMELDSVCGGGRPSKENTTPRRELLRREACAAGTGQERRSPGPTPASSARHPQRVQAAASQVPVWHAVREQRTSALAQTADLALLADFPFAGTLLDPRAVLAHLAKPDVFYHAWVAAKLAIQRFPGEVTSSMARRTMELFLAELGSAMMDGVEGPHYTFVDPRLCEDSKAMVEQARRLSDLFREKDERRDVIIGIPATFDGLVAAQELCHDDTPVKVNLTWVSNFAHARLCAEIGAAAITFPCDKMQRGCDALTTLWQNPQTAMMWARDDWLLEIEATTEFLRVNSCRTKAICANLPPNAGAVTLPAGTGCVALGDPDIATARENLQPFVSTHHQELPARCARKIVFQENSEPVSKENWIKACDTSYTEGLLALCKSQACAAMDTLEQAVTYELKYQWDMDNMGLTPFMEKYVEFAAPAVRGRTQASVRIVDGHPLGAGASRSEQTATNVRTISLEKEPRPLEEAAAAAEHIAGVKKPDSPAAVKRQQKRPQGSQDTTASKRKKQHTEVYMDDPPSRQATMTRDKGTMQRSQKSPGRRPLTPKHAKQRRAAEPL